MRLWGAKKPPSLVERSAEVKRLLAQGIDQETALKQAGMSGREFLYAQSVEHPLEWRAQLAEARAAFQKPPED